MCQRITCSVCGKPSYQGCGRHIESVLADVPKSERCTCRERNATESGATSGVKRWFRALLTGSSRR
ncbi:MAG TPA: hypothetical protein VGQ57_12175 [Polyangiaceae bacterium]|jgi:hypothetical protein|nr:hypothetical protein [Polyangiaceae bacterium]